MSRTSEYLNKIRPKVELPKENMTDDDNPTIRFGGKNVTPKDPIYRIARRLILKRYGIKK